MGERKVLNYFTPPDFDPAKIPRKIFKSKQHGIRNMIPMKIRCNICANYIGPGTKFNQRKEEVVGKKYLGVIKIFRFYFNCPVCCSEMTLLTDPKNSDYVVESGGKRCFEPWRVEDEQVEEVEDYMESLEKRCFDSKREMDKLAALHQLKSINSRRSKISVDLLLDNLRRKKEDEALLDNLRRKKEDEEELCAEDEAIIESRFGGGRREFVRRIDDWDDEESPVGEISNKIFMNKRKVVSGSPKTEGTSGRPCNIYAVKKKKESDNAILCLCKEYGSDEEN